MLSTHAVPDLLTQNTPLKLYPSMQPTLGGQCKGILPFVLSLNPGVSNLERCTGDFNCMLQLTCVLKQRAESAFAGQAAWGNSIG